MRVWNWAKNDNGEAELTIYGPIRSEAYWDSDVTLTDFYKEMCAIGSVDKIVVRINSRGGEVDPAMGIYNLLKESTAKITVIIDGYAASAATLIAMAGDEIKIPKAAIFMIHDPSGYGRGTAKDFRKAADNLDKYKACIIAAYKEKTGKSEEELWRMMEDESYMTGEEAVKEGFCTELIESDKDISISNEGIVFVNRAEAGRIPMKRRTEQPENHIQKETGKEKNDMDIKDKKMLEAAYPELVKEIRDDAAAEERARIKDIEDMTPAGFEDMATKAKFEDVSDSKTYMKAVVAETKKQNKQFAEDRAKELSASNTDKVKDQAPVDESGEDSFDRILDELEKEGGAE